MTLTQKFTEIYSEVCAPSKELAERRRGNVNSGDPRHCRRPSRLFASASVKKIIDFRTDGPLVLLAPLPLKDGYCIIRSNKPWVASVGQLKGEQTQGSVKVDNSRR